MNHKAILTFISLFSLFLALGFGCIILPVEVEAQGPNPADGVEIQAIVGSAFAYQGNLVKNGAPVDDSCNFQFGLWDAATGGSQQSVYLPLILRE